MECPNEMDVQEKMLEDLFAHKCPFGSSCVGNLSEDNKIALRNLMFSAAELEKKEKELFVKGYLLASSSFPFTAQPPRKKRKTNNEDDTSREHFVYCFRKHKLCRTAFRTVFGISERNQKTWAKQILGNEILHVHGNTHNIPKNTSTIQEIEDIEAFLMQYANIHGLPDPAEKSTVLLPSEMNKTFLYKDYKQIKERNKEKVHNHFVSIHSFHHLVTIFRWYLKQNLNQCGDKGYHI
eukprot:GCRY01001709.1.p1 GENE.GCRY01001709.1~~GCRY01001709.1.p1  ORF type:complete len:237 (+),score=26.85 GCRY01001709.1:158-868(+)